MKQTVLALLASVVMVLLAGDALAQGGRGGRRGFRNGWLTNYRQGKELARKTGKPLMVVLRCEP